MFVQTIELSAVYLLRNLPAAGCRDDAGRKTAAERCRYFTTCMRFIRMRENTVEE